METVCEDLAIGVHLEDIGTTEDAGAVNVIYGSHSGLTAEGNQIWHQDSAGIAGSAEAGDLFGRSLAAGDFNGDGCDDLSIGGVLDGRYGSRNFIYGSHSGLTADSDIALTHEDNGSVVNVETGDIITISLRGSGSTGYSWSLVDHNGEVLELVEQDYQTDPHPTGMVGVPGTYTYRFKALASGATTLKMVYAQPWDKESAPADEFTVSINVSGTPVATPPVEPTHEDNGCSNQRRKGRQNHDYAAGKPQHRLHVETC